jgi:hypothetical protein
MSAIGPGQLSPDGAYYWNGQQWVSTLSPDGAHRWNGATWVPTMSGAAGPVPARASRPASGLAFQLGGAALWAMGFGLAAILAPLFTTFYFPILPLAGLLNAYRALRSGRTAGGVLGIALNILGGVMSLFASGLLR